MVTDGTRTAPGTCSVPSATLPCFPQCFCHARMLEAHKTPKRRRRRGSSCQKWDDQSSTLSVLTSSATIANAAAPPCSGITGHVSQKHSRYGARNASATGELGVPICPRIESSPEGATKRHCKSQSVLLSDVAISVVNRRTPRKKREQTRASPSSCRPPAAEAFVDRQAGKRPAANGRLPRPPPLP